MQFFLGGGSKGTELGIDLSIFSLLFLDTASVSVSGFWLGWTGHEMEDTHPIIIFFSEFRCGGRATVTGDGVLSNP